MLSRVARPGQANALDEVIKSCRRHFIAVAAFSAFSNILFLAPTLYLMQVYDRVLPTGGLMTLGLLSLIVLTALGVQAVLDFVRSRLLIRASAQLDMGLSCDVVDAALMGKATDVQRNQSMRDFDALRQALSGSGLLSVLDAPWGLLYLVLAFMLHPALGALATATCIAMVCIALANERGTRDPLDAANAAAARSYSTLDAAIRSAEAVGALGMRRAVGTKHILERDEMIRLQSDASFTGSNFSSMNKTLRTTVQSVSVGLGAFLVIKGWMSPGSMMAASFLLSRALAPIEQITSAWPSLERGRNAYESLKMLLTQMEAAPMRTRLPRPQGHITLEGVSVAAPGSSRLVLHDITLNLEPGCIIGVGGGSGSGKSTLARTLVGSAKPVTGVVRVDGAALDDWDPEVLGRYVGFLPQDFALYEGTVKENISRFRGYLGEDPALLDEMAIEAARMAGAHAMILNLPNGYDTRLGVGGGGLSGGQTQRVALARALFGKPPILVLDEPNANLDGLSEQHLMTAMKQARDNGAIVIVMAHSRALLGMADRIVVLNQGRVDMSGSLRDVAALMQERRARARGEPHPGFANAAANAPAAPAGGQYTAQAS